MKPIVLTLLILCLLLVALMLPAVAFGKPDVVPIRAVNWVANGENSNNAFHEMNWQGGHSVLIKEMSDGSLQGHAFLVGVKPLDDHGVARAVAFLDHDPYTTAQIDVFREEGDYKVAEVIMDFGTETPFPFRYMKLMLWDGGEPKSADLAHNLIGIPVPPYWFPLGGAPPMEPFSNIQIHLGE